MFSLRTVHFEVDSISLAYADPEGAIRWWERVFECRRAPLPQWDDPLPNDVALQMPNAEEPAILICAMADARQVGAASDNQRWVITTNRVDAAHDLLKRRGADLGEILPGPGPRHFGVRDPEGNLIEVCEEV